MCQFCPIHLNTLNFSCTLHFSNFSYYSCFVYNYSPYSLFFSILSVVLLSSQWIQILTALNFDSFDFCPAAKNKKKRVWWASYGKVGKQQRKKKIFWVGKQQRKKKIFCGWSWTAARSLKLKAHVQSSKNCKCWQWYKDKMIERTI